MEAVKQRLIHIRCVWRGSERGDFLVRELRGSDAMVDVEPWRELGTKADKELDRERCNLRVTPRGSLAGEELFKGFGGREGQRTRFSEVIECGEECGLVEDAPSCGQRGQQSHTLDKGKGARNRRRLQPTRALAKESHAKAGGCGCAAGGRVAGGVWIAKEGVEVAQRGAMEHRSLLTPLSELRNTWTRHTDSIEREFAA